MQTYHYAAFAVKDTDGESMAASYAIDPMTRDQWLDSDLPATGTIEIDNDGAEFFIPLNGAPVMLNPGEVCYLDDAGPESESDDESTVIGADQLETMIRESAESAVAASVEPIVALVRQNEEALTGLVESLGGSDTVMAIDRIVAALSNQVTAQSAATIRAVTGIACEFVRDYNRLVVTRKIDGERRPVTRAFRLHGQLVSPDHPEHLNAQMVAQVLKECLGDYAMHLDAYMRVSQSYAHESDERIRLQDRLTAMTADRDRLESRVEALSSGAATSAMIADLERQLADQKRQTASAVERLANLATYTQMRDYSIYLKTADRYVGMVNDAYTLVDSLMDNASGAILFSSIEKVSALFTTPKFQAFLLQKGIPTLDICRIYGKAIKTVTIRRVGSILNIDTIDAISAPAKLTEEPAVTPTPKPTVAVNTSVDLDEVDADETDTVASDDTDTDTDLDDAEVYDNDAESETEDADNEEDEVFVPAKPSRKMRFGN